MINFIIAMAFLELMTPSSVHSATPTSTTAPTPAPTATDTMRGSQRVVELANEYKVVVTPASSIFFAQVFATSTAVNGYIVTFKDLNGLMQTIAIGNGTDKRNTGLTKGVFEKIEAA